MSTPEYEPGSELNSKAIIIEFTIQDPLIKLEK